MLDISRTGVEGVGKYLFSDDTGSYRSAPYEKVMINTMNMVNYLARHDLNGARVEARRFSIMQKYLRETENPAEEASAPGGYLAGFIFERSGRTDIALRYYDEALAHREFDSLIEPVSRLSRRGSYSTPRLRAFLKKHGKDSPATPPPPSKSPEASAALPLPPEEQAAATREELSSEPNANGQEGELLVIVNHGRVPALIARRIPIGLALTYATHHMTGPGMSGANRLAAQGLVTWINFPDLDDSRSTGRSKAWVNKTPVNLELAGALDDAARQAHEKIKGKIIASAITRLVTRIIAGEATGAAVGAATDNPLAGILASLATQATLTAADTPDTRSWSTLPARIEIGRLRLTPGTHQVRLSVRGKEKRLKVKMQPGGWQAVVLTVLR